MKILISILKKRAHRQIDFLPNNAKVAAGDVSAACVMRVREADTDAVIILASPVKLKPYYFNNYLMNRRGSCRIKLDYCVYSTYVVKIVHVIEVVVK